MADSVLTISLLGDKELLKGLQTGSDFAKNEIAKALNKAANDVRQSAAAKAPHKSGKLIDSLHVQYANGTTLVAKVGTNVVYARAQEFGTQGMVIHSHSKSGKQFTYVGNIKPKHYMSQAKQEAKPKLSQYLQLAATRIVSYMATGR